MLNLRTAEEVRRIRLLELLAQFGSWVVLNTKIGMKTPQRDSTLSQIANASVGSKTRKPKQMGPDIARRLEQACEKPVGWMDTDPALLAAIEKADAGLSAQALDIARLFDQLDAEGKAALDYMINAGQRRSAKI